MPADTEMAQPWTPETSPSGRVASVTAAPVSSAAPAREQGCACDECVARDQMWTRWA